MSKIALQGNVSGTGTISLVAPNTSTDRTLTLPDEAGTIITSGSATVLPKGVPAFRAYLSANQSISVATFTKVAFDSVDFDTDGFFDNTTNYRFKPTVAGYYLMTASVYFSYTGSIGNSTYVGLFKNNSAVSYDRKAGYVHYGTEKTSDLIYLNGSTDYVEVYGYYAGGSGFIFASNSNLCYVSGILVRAD